MPPFRLEPAPFITSKDKPVKIIHTKGIYDKRVKITDWEVSRESEPFDNDPFLQGKVNHFLSHYDRLGERPTEQYTTVTRLMLEQIKNKRGYTSSIIIPHKRLINYYTYTDTIDCNAKEMSTSCPKICSGDYSTTMQSSYGSHYSKTSSRAAIQVEPFSKYRKFKFEDPTMSDTKFYDEKFHERSVDLQRSKGGRWISYNPYTGLYSNGTAPRTLPRKCVKLDYE